RGTPGAGGRAPGTGGRRRRPRPSPAAAPESPATGSGDPPPSDLLLGAVAADDHESGVEPLHPPLALLEGGHVVQRRLLAAQLAQVTVDLEDELIEIGPAHALEVALGDQEVALGHVPRHRIRAAAGKRHEAGIISWERRRLAGFFFKEEENERAG